MLVTGCFKGRSRLCSLKMWTCHRHTGKGTVSGPWTANDIMGGGRQKGKPLTQWPGHGQWARLLIPQENSRGPQQLAAAGTALGLAWPLHWQAQQRGGCQQPHRW